MSITSERKIRANRTNARASTGPKTMLGRFRSARNATRHALSVPVYSDPILSEAVEASAREIAGANADRELLELARAIAEAQIDVRRVREARYQFLCRKLSEPYYGSRANVREKAALLCRLLRSKEPEMTSEALVNYLTTTPQGSERLALIVTQELRLLSAFDRYERRALSRRKFAIRAFDLGRLNSQKKHA